MVVKEQEFLDWLAHPVSQEYKVFLLKWRESLKEQWAAGGLVHDTVEATAIANASAVSQADLLSRLSMLDYEQFMETIYEK